MALMKGFGLLISVGVVLSTFQLLLLLAAQDKEGSCYSRKVTSVRVLLCMLSGQAVFWMIAERMEKVWSCYNGVRSVWILFVDCFLMAVLAGSLLMACITDCRNCMVYHFVWWVGGIAAAGLLLGSQNLLAGWGTLLIYGLLQEIVFSRMYGRADCHAFVVCAIAECAVGLGMKEYLLHMLAALLLLAVVQVFHRNIGKSGNLKKPVPFLPYITVSFWLILIGKRIAIDFS